SPRFEGIDAREGLSFFSSPIEAFLGEVGGPPPVVVAHSLGALVALDIALRRRVPIAGLVLIGAMGLGPIVSLRSRLYLRAGPERLARLRNGASWVFTRARSPGDPLGVESLRCLREELLSVRGGR